MQNNCIEEVSEFKYLGVLFSKTNSLKPTIRHVAEQGLKAVYSILKKSRALQLPIDLQLELFNKLVKPILLYGSEIWGSGNIEIIERVQLKFLKQILHLKRCTPNHIVYGEVGVLPMKVEIYTRMVSYWAKLIERNQDNPSLASLVYEVARSFYENCHISGKSTYFRWMSSIKTILDDNGFSGVWQSQTFFNQLWLKKAIKQKLTDIFVNAWYNSVENDSNYRIFKTHFGFESYLTKLHGNLLYYLISFRTRNHKFPCETGRWHIIPHNERVCNLCKRELGDEFHYLLSCVELKQLRKQYIDQYYYTRTNTSKYETLMKCQNTKQLVTLSKFIKVIYRHITSR